MSATYLTAKELIAINASVMARPPRLTDHHTTIIASIIELPQQVFFSTAAYPNIEDKLGIVYLKIITCRPFTDGNKRTAVLALAILAELNHYHLTYTNPELAALTLKLASLDGPDIDYKATYRNLRAHLAPANSRRSDQSV